MKAGYQSNTNQMARQKRFGLANQMAYEMAEKRERQQTLARVGLGAKQRLGAPPLKPIPKRPPYKGKPMKKLKRKEEGTAGQGLRGTARSMFFGL